MRLVEADGLALVAPFGIAVPDGVECASTDVDLPGAGPWMVKAQVPVADRGQGGGIVHCATADDVVIALSGLLGSRIGGHVVASCLVQPVQKGEERFIGLMLEPLNYGLRATYGAAFRDCPSHPGAVSEALAELAAGEPPPWRAHVVETGRALADALIRNELTLAGLHLFISDDGCVATGAEAVADLAALPRQSRIAALLRGRPLAYAETLRRLEEGVDTVVIDPDGEIAIVTAGAGLSAVLAEEVAARGRRVLGLYTMRAGQVRGDPASLGRALARAAAHPSLKAVLVNDFAGLTDLAAFAARLAAAIDATPALKVPVVARLAGHDAEEARRILAARQPAMVVTDDLETAIRALGKAA